MRVKKVNHNTSSGKTTIEYETVENEGKDRIAHSLHSGDEPHPTLVKSLEALRPEIEALAELPEGYLSQVRGVTIHRDEDDPDGEWTVTYTATKTLGDSRSPLVVNTPAVVPSSTAKVKSLLKHAEEFIRGKRAQGDLNLDATPEKPQVAGPKKAAAEGV